MAQTVAVPVFNGYEATRRCLAALERHTPAPTRIVLVDDASTDARIAGLLAEFAQRRANVSVLTNERNLGFTGAVNRAFAATTDDIVVLNSDAEVSAGWLEGLARCRASDRAIGIACPLSNRATILSVAGVEELYRRADGTTDVDALAGAVRRAAERSYVRLPTAVGFCMLITRELLERVGPFDAVYGRGYGEENDFSMRALDLGFEIACADDVFVYHAGEASFGEVEKIDEHRRRNREILARRWPMYEPGVAAWSRANPLRRAMERINAEAERERLPGRPRVLHVVHRFGTRGGIEEHTRAIIDQLGGEAAFTVLVPQAMQGAWTDMAVERIAPHLRVVRMNFDLAERGIRVIGHASNLADESLENAFRALLAGGYDVVHFQSLVGWNTMQLPRIARESGARVVMSAHDLSLPCADYNMMTGPQDLPCGRDAARGADTGCVACLRGKSEAIGAVRPPPAISSYIEARHAAVGAALTVADAVVCPSEYVAGRMRRAFPAACEGRLAVLGHGVNDYPIVYSGRHRSMLRVAFLGRFSDRKGADVLLAVARGLAGQRIVFEVWGPIEDRLKAPAQAAGMIMRGHYDNAELEQKLRGIDLVIAPSLMEESFCLVVSEAQRLGIPVAASRTGAIPERLRDGETGFLFPPGDVAAIARLLLKLRDDRGPLDAVAARLRVERPKTLAANSREYLDLYMRLARRATHDAAKASGNGAEVVRRLLQMPRVRHATPLGSDEYDRWLTREVAPATQDASTMPLVALDPDADSAAELQRVNRALQDAGGQWIAVMQSGDTLAPGALAQLAAACAANPESFLVYCDDDAVSTRGERYDPAFKPPFDRELLRHRPYIAGLCALQGERVVAAGGLRLPGWAGIAELAQRMTATGDTRGVVALRALLCHRLDVRPAPPALIERAERAPPQKAQVSVLVRAADAPELAPSCIGSLLVRSAGRIREVFVDLDAARCAELDAALAANGVRVATRPVGKPGHSALALALASAAGDALAVVDARCVNFRAGWLDELEAAIGLGVAGACLAVRAADGDDIPGWDLLGGGAHSVAGPPPSLRGAGALAELYGAPREVAALGPRLALLRREAAFAACNREEMNAAGRFDLAHLGLELRRAGHALRARPSVAAEYRGTAGPWFGPPGPLRVLAPPPEAAWMRARWGDALEDPCFHPALKLTGRRLAPQARFGPRREGVPRVCAFPFDRWATGELRVRQPMAALERAARAEIAMMAEHDSGEAPNALEWRRIGADILYAHNFLHDYQLQSLESARDSTRLRVVGMDDLLTALPEGNPYAATIYGDIGARIERAVASSDRLIVSTQPLADAYGRAAKDVRVIPNALDDARWGGLANAVRVGARPRVGWAGARQHLGDLALLEPVVRATHRRIDWIFFGMCPASIRPLAAEVHEMVPVREYPARLAALGLDVAVAPLLDHPFNRAKSNLRLLEYGILGIPAVASAVTPYLDSPAALVGPDPEEWVAAVLALALDRERAHASGVVLRRWVLAHGMLSGTLDAWSRALDPTR